MGANNCSANGTSICTNTIGDYICTCYSGYEGDGFNCTGKTTLLSLQLALNCIIDINECDTGTDHCSGNGSSICTNTIGSYYCNCSHGYEGDGFNCTGL